MGGGSSPILGPMNNAARTETLDVANTIRDQIGSRAFYMMGAKNLLGSPDSLAFQIRGSMNVNRISITLDPSDTYTVRFVRVRGLKVKEVATVENVYADALKPVIEKHTGLYLSL